MKKISRKVIVMAGLVPAIYALFRRGRTDVDTRHKAGHDGVTS